MSWWEWLLLAAAFMFALWGACVLALVLAGRRESARALAGFIPDCIVLVRRLLHDPRVPRRYKLLLAVLFGYLALPIDLVPDFIPVAGQLDDAVVVAVVLRIVLRGGGPDLLREHWPGPNGSLALVLRVSGYSDAPVDPAEEQVARTAGAVSSGARPSTLLRLPDSSSSPSLVPRPEEMKGSDPIA